MVCIDDSACWVAGSLCNAAGFLAALNIWNDAFAPKPGQWAKRLLWLVPVLLVSAWLESALHPAGTVLRPQRIAADLLAWTVLALAFTGMRQIGQRRSRPEASRFAGPLSTPGPDVLSAELEPSLKRFLDAADRAEVAAVSALYDPEFACVRVADSGGFAHLSREQMLTFFQRASHAAASQEADPHAAATARETKIHHVEVVGDTGLVLLTRVKDLGSGWEPMFYSLIWRKQAGNWHLLREFVHQRTSPKW